VQFEARYRYPIFWAALLTADYAVIEMARGGRNDPETSVHAGKEVKSMVAVLK
jgi:hypothetical protein